MGYAVNSAETSSRDPAKLSKAGELADGQYSERALRNPPSLQALKLQDVLMKNAGGKIANDQWHELPLATFKQVKGFRNLTHEDVGRVDTDEGGGRLRYKFDDEFRKIVEQSNLYAILDYRAGLAMSSRYAHRLHEMISFRAARERQMERFTVEELRARLGVQTGKLARWPDFKKYSLDAAIDEVNQSSRFRVSYRITKRERRKRPSKTPRRNRRPIRLLAKADGQRPKSGWPSLNLEVSNTPIHGKSWPVTIAIGTMESSRTPSARSVRRRGSSWGQKTSKRCL